MNIKTDTSKQVIPCWSCHGPLNAGLAFCPTCNAVQQPAGIDHFVRLGLDIDFDVDLKSLDEVYYKLQRELHPDRFATSTAKEKAYSQAQATAINDAYETIKDPLKRADYIVHIRGINVMPDGCNLVNDPSILMEAMEVREKLAAAQTIDHIDTIANNAREEIKDIIHGISLAFRGDDIEGACQLTTRLKYLNKLLGEVRQRRTQIA